MGLDDSILRGVYGYGYEKPSAVQCRAVIPLMSGHDVIAQAQSGKGKTASFCLGILGQLDFGGGNTRRPVLQAVVLAPTRELASQSALVMSALGKYTPVKVLAAVGGTSRRDMVAELRRGVHAMVGTPGRVLDMINSGSVDVSTVKVLVVDEADEMLAFNFMDSLYEVFQSLPGTVQVGLFSATMPPEMLEVSERFMRDPVTILIQKEELTLDGILQYYIELDHPSWKYDTLADLYGTLSVAQCVIFCNTRRVVESLAASLDQDGHAVSAVHGGMSPEERKAVFTDFKESRARVLVTTDLYARGIDVQSVSLVINYDVPFRDNVDNYVHRIGRCGRFGRKGLAINLVATSKDVENLRFIEGHLHTEIQPLPANFVQSV